MTTKVSQTWMFGRGVGRVAPQGGAECAVGLHDVITPSRLEASSPAKVAVDMIWTCSWTPLRPTAMNICYRTADNLYIWRDLVRNMDGDREVIDVGKWPEEIDLYSEIPMHA